MTFSDAQIRGLARALDHARGERLGQREADAPGAPGQPQRLLGRYVLAEKIGEGGMATVYRGTDLQLHRPVAIKILKERLLESVLGRRRFAREAEAVARLSHLNVITLYDSGEDDGRPFFVMEYVPGGTLERAPREGPPWAAALLERVARGVQHAHDHGIVHRDLKPSNILRTETGEPKVADFGLAHVETHETALTKTGATLGTPHYMAPEQVRGDAQRISTRTDVYGLGGILYQLLTGRPPHEGDTAIEIYAKIVGEEPRSIRALNPEVPPELEAIAFRALEKQPLRRYESAGAMADDLLRFLAGETVEAKPLTPLDRLRKFVERKPRLVIGAGAAVGLVLAAAVFAVLQRSRASSAEGETERMEAVADRERVAREMEERRGSALRELGRLWTDVVLAKKDLHNQTNDPAKVRARIEEARDRVSAYIGKYPDQPQGYYVRARAWFFLGELADAKRDLETALEREASFTPAETLLGRVKLEQYIQSLWGDPLRAEERERRAKSLLEEARVHLSRERASVEKWGMNRIREDDVAETVANALKARYVDDNRAAALRILKEADEREPSEEYSLWLSSWAPTPGEEMDLIEQALARMPHYALAYARRGACHRRENRIDLAIDDFTKAITIHPRFAEAYSHRASAREAKGDLDGAIADYDIAVSLQPGTADRYFHRAFTRALRGEHDLAIEDYSTTIRLDPVHEPAYCNRGLSYWAKGDRVRALDDWNRCIELNPDRAGGWHNRALALYELRDYDGAIAAADKAILLEPRRAVTHQLRGLAKKAKGDLSGAIRDFTQEIQNDPASVDARTARVEALVAAREFRAAVDDYAWLIRRNPRDAKLRFDSGYARKCANDLDGALADFTSAIELRENFAEAYVQRGGVRKSKGDLDGAIADFEEAIRMRPRMAEAYANRGVARGAKGDRAGAIRDLETALELSSPAWIHRTEVERLLKLLRESK